MFSLSYSDRNEYASQCFSLVYYVYTVARYNKTWAHDIVKQS